MSDNYFDSDDTQKPPSEGEDRLDDPVSQAESDRQDEFVPISELAPPSELIPMSQSVSPDEPVLPAEPAGLDEPIGISEPAAQNEFVPIVEAFEADDVVILGEQTGRSVNAPPVQAIPPRGRMSEPAPQTSGVGSAISTTFFILLAVVAVGIQVAQRHAARQAARPTPTRITIPDYNPRWDPPPAPRGYSSSPNSPSRGRTTTPGPYGNSGANRYNPRTEIQRVMEINEANRRRREAQAERIRNMTSPRRNNYHSPRHSIPGNPRSYTPQRPTGYRSPYQPGVRR
jgi:hypothetical protein